MNIYDHEIQPIKYKDMKKLNYINNNGITFSVAQISYNISEKGNFYLDLLKDGKYLVSEQDKKIAIFSDAEEAIIFFVVKVNPLPELTEEEIDEAFEYLEECINNQY